MSYGSRQTPRNARVTFAWRDLDRLKCEIFNTDQGSQFTASSFIQFLQKNRIQISMDGRGAAGIYRVLCIHVDDLKARPECRSLLHRKQEHLRRRISTLRITYRQGLQ